jgi:heme O synthase-like polyprenyltransferase
MRNVLKEATLLTIALFATGVGAAFASLHPVLVVQVLLAGWIGVSGAVAQPSFDAITQRNVAPGAQGRTFARFAVRQQLLWVIGALIPVAIVLSFGVGDRLLAVLMLIAAAVYPIGRHSAREDSA